jgi:hypothetical protein
MLFIRKRNLEGNFEVASRSAEHCQQEDVIGKRDEATCSSNGKSYFNKNIQKNKIKILKINFFKHNNIQTRRQGLKLNICRSNILICSLT